MAEQYLRPELRLLGNRISDLIEEKGFQSPYQFWLFLGDEVVSRQGLNKIISGKSDPKFLTLLKIARNLGISISELLDITELEVNTNEEE